ncbi:cytochrome c [Desulfosporosinus sp. Sb-LF]|uniref:c-type cytochrome n=1 Tax=Desulfosporosinus sp. Sb-LF TaxID=2560027 RepID=UPI0013054705|nr:cytochrome c [Desulfosporosinus sp. Sb-LF]
MKKLLITGLLVGTVAIVSGCGSQTPAPTPAPPPAPQVQSPTTQTAPTTGQTPASSTSTTTTAASGKDVYDQKCAGCHGAGGAGGSAAALNKESRTQAQVYEVVKKGKGSMPAYANMLSDAEMQAVSQYVAGLKK